MNDKIKAFIKIIQIICNNVLNEHLWFFPLYYIYIYNISYIMEV